MPTDEKRTFPLMATSKWFELREAFKRSIPGVISEGYLGSVLKMKPSSARTNVLPTLRKVKLIDKDGKSTPLATKWRDDKEYKAVCDVMLKNCYPEELLHAAPNAKADRDAGARWFAQATSAGSAAVDKMVAFYGMLQEGVPERSKAAPANAGTKTTLRSPVKKTAGAAPRRVIEKPSGESETGAKSGEPSVHVNLQIHISPDASTDQIKEIFANIAKYIYNKA